MIIWKKGQSEFLIDVYDLVDAGFDSSDQSWHPTKVTAPTHIYQSGYIYSCVLAFHVQCRVAVQFISELTNFQDSDALKKSA
jgi:hypothetical protein